MALRTRPAAGADRRTDSAAAPGALAAWALLEFALTAWAAVVVVIHFPLWLARTTAAPDARLALATAAATLLLLAVGPVAGALSDRSSRRPFVVAAVLVTAVATAAIGPTGLLASTVAFVVASAAQGLGILMLDALLPALAPAGRLGRTSGLGIVAAFVGSLLGTALSLVAIVRLGLPQEASFAVAVGILLLLGLPAAFRLPARTGEPAALSTASLSGGFARVRRSPQLTRMLAVHLCAFEAGGTLVRFIALYAVTEIGLSATEAQAAVLLGIVGGLAGGALAGLAADRHGGKPALAAALWGWVLVTALTAAVPLLALPAWAFWAAVFAAGAALAATQASDRALLLRLAPPEAVGEVVGVFAAVGRAALLIGPLLWGLVVDGLGWGRPAAVLSLGAACLLALALLRPLPDPDAAPQASAPLGAADAA